MKYLVFALLASLSVHTIAQTSPGVSNQQILDCALKASLITQDQEKCLVVLQLGQGGYEIAEQHDAACGGDPSILPAIPGGFFDFINGQLTHEDILSGQNIPCN